MMFEVYELASNGSLGFCALRTDTEGDALAYINRLRGVGKSYLYAVSGVVNHEFGPDFDTVNLGDDA